MLILALDPGTKITGVVLYEVTETLRKVCFAGMFDNEKLLNEDLPMYVRTYDLFDNSAKDIEMILLVEFPQHMGKKAGATLFETAYWAGRFIQRWQQDKPRRYERIKRTWVKQQLTGSTATGDPDVGLALRIRFNEPPAPRHPKGELKGVTEHGWAALGVAVAWAENNVARRRAGWGNFVDASQAKR